MRNSSSNGSENGTKLTNGSPTKHLNGYNLYKKDATKNKSDDDESADQINNSNNKVEQDATMSSYKKLMTALHSEPRLQWQLALGKRIGFYSLRGELGSGNFSKVKIGAHSLTKERVAIKILDKTKMDKKTKRLLSREISSMERLHHPHIVHLYEVIHTEAKLYLVMEYASGGELFTKLSMQGKMQEDTGRIIFSQIVSAVEHMHQHNIIHRDLKAENVFYSERKHVKVGDFGFSTKANGSEDALNTFCGSPPYAAPELFRDSYYYGEYVDIWALGVMLFFIVTGTMPFKADTVGKLKKRILLGQFNIPSHVSTACKQIIRNLLLPEPTKRWSIAEIKSSEWLSRILYPEPNVFYRLNPAQISSENARPEEAYALLMMEKLGISSDELMSLPAGGESFFSWHGDRTPEVSSPATKHEKSTDLQPWNAKSAKGDQLRYVTINSASAIVGTYRILLLRAHKRLTGPTSKEELRKFRAIAQRAYDQALDVKTLSQTCEDCTRVRANVSKISSSGNSPTVSSATSAETRTSQNEQRLSQRGRKQNRTVRSKMCIIL